MRMRFGVQFPVLPLAMALPLLAASEQPAPAQISLLLLLGVVALTGVSVYTIVLNRRLRRSRAALERESAQQALERERLDFEARLLAHTPVAIVAADREYRVTHLNPAAERMYGWTAREVLNRKVEDVIRYLEGGATRQEIREGLATKGAWSGEIKFVGHSGEPAWAELTVNLLRDRAGQVTGAVSGVRDIEDRKRAEEALRESQKQLQELLENVQLIAVILDRHGAILFANPYLLRLTGWTREEVAGRDWFELFTAGAVREQVRNIFTTGMSKGDIPCHFENPIRTRDGQQRLVEWDNTVLHGPGGEVASVASIGRDVTDLKTMESQYRHLQKMESVGRLAGGVAHDFNNLLTVINGHAQLGLGQVAEQDPARARFNQILLAGQRAAAITHQLLAFSRKQVLQPRVLDLNQVVQDTEPLLRGVVGEQVALVCRLEPELGKTRADALQLQQVVMHLALNARDAMPQGGTLILETGNVELDAVYAHAHPEVVAGHYVLVAVTDTGRGMDVATQAKIFEPFFTTKEQGKGTGLGLSTVYGFVKQSGGHLSVYSEVGRGTTFKVYLPRVGEALGEPERPAEAVLADGTGSILLAEDEPGVRRLAAEVLRGCGYRVWEAASAADAEAICQSMDGAVDLLLTDVVMPDRTGPQLAERLRSRYPRMRVLYMSGYTENVIVHQGVLAPGTPYLAKPFSPEALSVKVRQTLAEPRGQGRILVVDDEAPVRGLLREILAGAGYQVKEAGDGKQAVALAAGEALDLVITDLVMPEQEGLETIGQLRREHPGVKIIAISGAFSGGFLKVADMLGANATLSKPVSAAVLLETVRKVLES